MPAPTPPPPPSLRLGFSFFITSFAIGVGGTGWLIQGEVFPTAVRGRAAAIGASVDWIANFAIIEVFPAWHNAIGLGWVMVSFAVIAVLAIGFAARWLPESKGLSVEEAVAVFERPAEGRKAPAQRFPSGQLEGPCGYRKSSHQHLMRDSCSRTGFPGNSSGASSGLIRG